MPNSLHVPTKSLSTHSSQQSLTDKSDIARDQNTIKKVAQHYFFKISGGRIPIHHKQYVSVFFGLPAASKSNLIRSILQHDHTAHAIQVCQDEVKKSHPQFHDIKRLCGPSWSQELDDVGLKARAQVMENLLKDGHSMICEGVTSFMLPVQIAQTHDCAVRINVRLIPNVLVYRNNLTRMIQQKEKEEDVRGYTFAEYTGKNGYIIKINTKVKEFFENFPSLSITAHFQYFDAKEHKKTLHNAHEFMTLCNDINHSDENNIDLQNTLQVELNELSAKWKKTFITYASSVQDYLNFEFGHYKHRYS
jgi:hypothetical protein